MAASDQIVFSARLDSVKEGSQFKATARFRDRATDADVIPTTVRYRIDCLTTGRQILDWTVITPGTTAAITVTSAQNAMQDQCNRCERKQITVAADYGSSTQFNETLTYDVKNVAGIR